MEEPRFLSGQLLLAMPGIGDPRFEKAVIAMCVHDENGALGIGLVMDGSKYGMGQRGQRWSAIVNDGVVEQLNVEEPGGYGVSGAEHMLGQL